jgi:hypothetical protein
MDYTDNVTQLAQLPNLSDIEPIVFQHNQGEHHESDDYLPDNMRQQVSKHIRTRHVPLFNELPERESRRHSRRSYLEGFDADDFAPRHPPMQHAEPDTCLSVSNHVEYCPICSRLYRNHSHLLYALIVFLLGMLAYIAYKFIVLKSSIA